jgi:peptide/nickel transport system permease protein
VKQLQYILKRILHMIPVLICVTILIFSMIRLIPGSAAEIMLGDKATPEKIAILEKKMGLDKSLPEQYLLFMKQVLTLDFGDSVVYARSVLELIQPRVAVTVSLVLVTTLLVLFISFPLGYLAGSRSGGLADGIIKSGALVAVSLPQFWVGTLFLLLFALRMRLFPVGTWGETVGERLHALILPGLTGALTTSALMIKNLRSNVIDVVGSDYVDFARSKGLKDGRIMGRHVLRNAMISTVTLLSLRVANMLGGSIVIETVFSLPGLGKLLVDSIFARDYAVVQTVVLLLALLVLAVNLLTDIAYSLLDPRVRLE